MIKKISYEPSYIMHQTPGLVGLEAWIQNPEKQFNSYKVCSVFCGFRMRGVLTSITDGYSI